MAGLKPRPAYKGQASKIASGRTWPWLAAAAAVLAAATVLQVAGERAVTRAGGHIGPDPVEQASAALVAALGGDADARQLAAALLAEEQRREKEDDSGLASPSIDSGGGR
jgi:hypothetical protein